MVNALIKMLGQKILPVLQMLSVGELLLCVAFEGGFLLPCAAACEVRSDGGSTPKLGWWMSLEACGHCLEDFPC